MEGFKQLWEHMQSMDRTSEKIAYGAGVAAGTVGGVAGVVCGTKIAFDWVIDRYDEFETRSIERIMRKIDANRRTETKGFRWHQGAFLQNLNQMACNDVEALRRARGKVQGIHRKRVLASLEPNSPLSATVPTATPFLSVNKSKRSSLSQLKLEVPRRDSLRINAISKKWEPTKVAPQADRVLIRLEDLHLPEKSSGGVLLPKSAVKFERYLMGEVLSVGAEVGEVKAGKRVLFSDINAYEASSITIRRNLHPTCEFSEFASEVFSCLHEDQIPFECLEDSMLNLSD